jgi:GTP cyclohydrolase I
MTEQIAGAMMDILKPKGMIVMIEAEHLCMSMRGVKKQGSKTVTFAVKGVFQDDSCLREQFFHMLGHEHE